MATLHIHTTTGELNADFSIIDPHAPDESFSIVLNAKNGLGHNSDYFDALEEILSSLRSAGAQIVRIEVISKVAMKAEPYERTLPINFPIILSSVLDIQALRKAICAAQTMVVSKAAKGGNSHRKIRIDVITPHDVTRERFEAGLVPANGEFRTSGSTDSLDQLESGLSYRDKEDDAHEQQILDRAIDGPVEKYQLVKSRRGQGAFRENVLMREKRCRIFGVSHSFVLRASHIKPWSKSNDTEKIDGDNGLMLSPHADTLFDLGYVSFKQDGTLLVSPLLPPEILETWAIPSNLNVGSFSDAQEKYLKYHRTAIFKS